MAKKRAGLLYDRILAKHKGCALIELDFKQLPDQKLYITTGHGDVSGRFTFVFADNFVKNAMIW